MRPSEARHGFLRAFAVYWGSIPHIKRLESQQMSQPYHNIHESLAGLAVEIGLIDFDEDNARHNHDVAGIAASLAKFGQRMPVILRPNPKVEGRYILEAGEGRVKAARQLNWTHIAGIVCHDDDETAAAFALADNLLGDKSEFNQETLEIMLDRFEVVTDIPGVDEAWLNEALKSGAKHKLKGESSEGKKGALLDRFVVPPFTVLDSRQGYWQARKTTWKDLGIIGHAGRVATAEGAKANPFPTGATQDFRTSVYRRGESVADSDLPQMYSHFDPVLCEIMVSWHTGQGDIVIDPFAGGPTAGIVSAILGRKFIGVDIRQEQVEVNQEIAKAVSNNVGLPYPIEPEWLTGDSAYLVDVLQENEKAKADLIFSCPPYYDLEVYSDLDQDLSTAPTYQEFIDEYRAVIAQCYNALRPNRFAVFVVGDIRDKAGLYCNFVGDTITAWLDAGAALYNEAVLLTVAGSLPIRVGKQFTNSRKLGKSHQNVLTFVKGDPLEAAKAAGEVEVWQPNEGV